MRARFMTLAIVLLFGSALALGKFELLPLPWSIGKEPTTASTKPTPKRKETVQRKATDPQTQQAALEPQPADAEKQPSAASTEQATSAELRIDIAKIAEDGTSVFAGNAAPNEVVTVLADGKPVAQAKTDANGDWTAVTEHKFGALDPQMSYRVGGPLIDLAETPKQPTAGGKVAAVEPPMTKGSGKSATEKVMKDFENLVEAAREEARQDRKGTDTATSTNSVSIPSPLEWPVARDTPSAATSTQTSKEAEARTAKLDTWPVAGEPARKHKIAAAEPAVKETRAAPAAQPSSTSIPVPMTFVYNEATLTDEGRRAASLLSEYLTLKKLASVSLTGHADERGSRTYNMDLSRERLDAIATYLRSSGYSGRLDLIPKGEADPYLGVDRTSVAREELMQLDRRVELRVAQ